MENWKALEEDYRRILRDYVEPLPPKPGERAGAKSAWLAVQTPPVKAEAKPQQRREGNLHQRARDGQSPHAHQVFE